MGYHPDPALQALLAYRRHARPQKETPDVILLDIQMPEMDGYEVATHLKGDAELARIPIVGVSSFAMPGDREKAIRMGFAGYIEKPVDPEHFSETVLSILGREPATS